MKNIYTVWASNKEGTSSDVASGDTFTSINAAAAAARSEMGSGWTIHIIDEYNAEVKTFTIR